MSKGVMYVDNIRVEYDNEPNVLEVCRKAGVEIPNFCFHSDLSVYGACRMCMVEEEGTGKIDAACTMPPKNELHIRTNTARLLKYRRMIIELLLSAHCRDCTTCEKNRACRLQFDLTHEHMEFFKHFMEENLEGVSIADLSEEKMDQMVTALGTYMMTLSPLVQGICEMSKDLQKNELYVSLSLIHI